MLTRISAETIAKVAAYHAAGLCDREIAVRLASGLTRDQVKYVRHKHGVGPANPETERRPCPQHAAAHGRWERVRDLTEAGLSDAAIADRLGVARYVVTYARLRLGLRPNDRPMSSPACRAETIGRANEAVAAGHARGLTTRQIAVEVAPLLPYSRGHYQAVYGLLRNLGLRPHVHRTAEHRAALRASRSAKSAALAAAYGLPPGVTPKELLVLTALAAGPLTNEQIIAALGRPTVLRFVPEMGGLMRKGLVARLPVPGQRTWAGRRYLYMLTAAAMDLMAAKGGES